MTTICEEDVLRFMEKGKLYTISMIRSKLDTHYYAVDKILESLVNKGLVAKHDLADNRKVYKKV